MANWADGLITDSQRSRARSYGVPDANQQNAPVFSSKNTNVASIATPFGNNPGISAPTFKSTSSIVTTPNTAFSFSSSGSGNAVKYSNTDRAAAAKQYGVPIFAVNDKMVSDYMSTQKISTNKIQAPPKPVSMQITQEAPKVENVTIPGETPPKSYDTSISSLGITKPDLSKLDKAIEDVKGFDPLKSLTSNYDLIKGLRPKEATESRNALETSIKDLAAYKDPNSQIYKTITNRAETAYQGSAASLGKANAMMAAANPYMTEGMKNTLQAAYLRDTNSGMSVLQGQLSETVGKMAYQAASDVMKGYESLATIDEAKFQNDINNANNAMKTQLEQLVAAGNLTASEANILANNYAAELTTGVALKRLGLDEKEFDWKVEMDKYTQKWQGINGLMQLGGKNIDTAAKMFGELFGIEVDPERLRQTDSLGVAEYITEIAKSLEEINPKKAGALYAIAAGISEDALGISTDDPAWTTEYDSITDWNTPENKTLADSINALTGKPKGTPITKEDYIKYKDYSTFGEGSSEDDPTIKQMDRLNKLIFGNDGVNDYFTKDDGAIILSSLSLNNNNLSGAIKKLIDFQIDPSSVNFSDTEVKDLTRLMGIIYADNNPNSPFDNILTNENIDWAAENFGFNVRRSATGIMQNNSFGWDGVFGGGKPAPEINNKATGAINTINTPTLDESSKTGYNLANQRVQDDKLPLAASFGAPLLGAGPISMAPAIMGVKTIADLVKRSKQTKLDKRSNDEIDSFMGELNPETPIDWNAKPTTIPGIDLNKDSLVSWSSGKWTLNSNIKRYIDNNKGSLVTINNKPMLLIGYVDAKSLNTAGFILVADKDGKVYKLNNGGGKIGKEQRYSASSINAQKPEENTNTTTVTPGDTGTQSSRSRSSGVPQTT